jgi:hypothetical protein
MEAVSTSETSVNFSETTRRHIPEDSQHQTSSHMFERTRERLRRSMYCSNTSKNCASNNIKQ